MGGFDLRLDKDGDYIDDGEGFFESDETAATAVRHQVLGELGSWVGDLQAGRIQRGIKGRNLTDAEAELERDSLIRGLEVLQIAGLIDTIEVTLERVGVNRLNVAVRTRDTQSGGTINVGEIVNFGV